MLFEFYSMLSQNILLLLFSMTMVEKGELVDDGKRNQLFYLEQIAKMGLVFAGSPTVELYKVSVEASV